MGNVGGNQRRDEQSLLLPPHNELSASLLDDDQSIDHSISQSRTYSRSIDEGEEKSLIGRSPGRTHRVDDDFLIDVNDSSYQRLDNSFDRSTDRLLDRQHDRSVLHPAVARRRQSLINPSGYQVLQPVDVFFPIFTYLTQLDLVRSAQVSSRWLGLAYDPALWLSIHLCHAFTKINDQTIERMLSSGRYPNLKTLCLDRCAAITDKSLYFIAKACPRLEVLSLVDCHNLTTDYVLTVLDRMPQLKKVELLGVCSNHARVVGHFFRQNRAIDLCMFLVEWQVKAGLKMVYTPDQQSSRRPSMFEDVIDRIEQPISHFRVLRTSCRHGRSRNANATPCWGDISGRVVLSSMFYHLPGNYPFDVSYFCQQHDEADVSDPAPFKRCQNCECLLTDDSMYDDNFCKFCFDAENLTRKLNWIPLSLEDIRAVGFSEIIGKTIRIADRKNIPHSLVSYQTSECRLDYTLPNNNEDSYEEIEEKQDMLQNSVSVPLDAPAGEHEHAIRRRGAVDPTRVPITAFLSVNASRLDRTVDSLKNHLRRAAKAGSTRALLVLNDNQDIEVLADHRVIIDGQEGLQYLELINALWSSARSLLACVATLFILSSLFAPILSTLFFPPDGGFGHGAMRRDLFVREPVADFDWFIFLGTLSCFIFFGLILLILYWRMRRWFDFLFKKFLTADIFMIYVFGISVIMIGIFFSFKTGLDWLSMLFIASNIAGISVYALYFDIGLEGPGDNEAPRIEVIDEDGEGHMQPNHRANNDDQSVVAPAAARAAPQLPQAGDPAPVNPIQPAAPANAPPPVPAAPVEVHKNSSHIHRFSIVLMNATMAILLSGTLPYYIANLFVVIVAGVDVISQLRTRAQQLVPPVLLPSAMIIPVKPMILFSVNKVYMRPGELMWYAVLATIMERFDMSLFIGLMAVFTLCTLVLPYVTSHRRWRRPLPLMLLWALYLWWQEDRQFSPLQLVFNRIEAY